MVDRAEAEPVAHDRQPLLLEIADDVGGVEQACLLEPADCALVRVCRQHARPEAGLVQSHARFADGVAALERVVGQQWLALVVGADHPTRREGHGASDRVVAGEEDGPLGSVVPGPGADEVDERHLQLEGGAQRPVVGLVDVAGAVGVDEAVGRLLVVVG
jgi:hypothetical protein